jgi:putative ABC transport system permease protein
MIQHYLTVALRVFSKSRTYSLINVFGLTLGISSSLLIFLFVHDELTYDHNHSQVNNIYRLHSGWRSSSDYTSQMYARAGFNEGEILKRDFSEIDQVVRFNRIFDARIEKPGTDEFFLEYLWAAEPSVFKVFDFPLIAGDPEKLLPDDHSVVITEKMALKYFNKTDVLGQTIRWFSQDTIDYKVSGVMKDYPDNTHMKVDFIIPLQPPTDVRSEWFEYGYFTYFTLHPGSKIEDIESRIKHFTKKDVADVEKEIGFIAEHEIMSMNKIHMYSNLPGELDTPSKASYVYVFLVVGIFILAMACINFMNLATARSMVRAKEIGIRKVIGAIKTQLVRQFLGEAFMMTIVATAISIFIVYYSTPILNEFSGKNLTFIDRNEFWIAITALVALVTLFSGAYPSFYLSAFKPVDTLKGSFKHSDKGAFLRKGLVVFQFTISIALIAGMMIIWSHINFMRTKDLGFDKDQVMIVSRGSNRMKEQLQNISGIESMTISNRVPGFPVGGRTIIKGWNKTDQQLVLGQLAVDHDFIELYGLKLIAGRNFDKNITTDLKEAFIVNEAALNVLGFDKAEDAIGQQLWLEEWGDHKGRVVGVLKDFHFIGVNAAIEPFAMFLHTEGNRFLSAKISSNNLQQVIKQVESAYKDNFPGRPFQYSFVDQDFDNQYKGEERFMSIFSLFAAIGIIIACLGLYGLATFMTEQRTKEVGIRKILGASVKTILGLLTRDFVKLVFISFVIAVPIAYWGMEKWLTTFPYREDIDPVLFAFAGIAVLGITISVIGYRAFYTATTNPVNSLRSE